MLEIGKRYVHDWVTMTRKEYKTTYFVVLERQMSAFLIKYDSGVLGYVDVGSKRDIQSEVVKV